MQYAGAGPKPHISGGMKPTHKETHFSLTSEISAIIDSSVFDPTIKSIFWWPEIDLSSKESLFTRI